MAFDEGLAERIRALLADQADVQDEHIRTAVVVAAGTGLRQGELFGLTVDRVDLPRQGPVFAAPSSAPEFAGEVLYATRQLLQSGRLRLHV
jgi:hypothetical protein